MVQKYQNEIPPIFYYGISTKTSEKDLKIPNLQALTLGRIIIITLYIYYCVLQYRWPGASGLPFAFRGSGAGDLDKEWNLHPVLMIAGFIYCMGQGD